jgi:hypothetical protein
MPLTLIFRCGARKQSPSKGCDLMSEVLGHPRFKRCSIFEVTLPSNVMLLWNLIGRPVCQEVLKKLYKDD